jgi:glycosyltransferase involved in cell wall biosynthesis
VATDAEGSRESLGPGAGAIVPVGDAPALAAALIDRLLDAALAEAEGTAGQARAAQCHDVALTAETIASMYAEILALRGVAQPTGTVE